MLIDFTIENYRSIKEPVTLSAIAQPSRDSGKASAAKRRIKSDNEIAPSAPVIGRDFELLPVLAIFGANASGKSNVLRALSEFLGYVTLGPKDLAKTEALSLFTPFLLAPARADLLTKFHIRIALGAEIFIYSIALDQSRIRHEKLERIPPLPKRLSRKPIYERIWSEADQEYVWINGLELGGSYQEIQSTLRDHEPFMSLMATRLKVPIIEPLADWLTSRWPSWEIHYSGRAAPRLLFLSRDYPERVGELIRQFDSSITRTEIWKQGVTNDHFDNYRVFVWHDAPHGPVRWPLLEESAGTKRLVAFAPFVLKCLEEGSLLTIDELDASLHPHITRRIVEMFQSVETNPKRAQLIFTSHDNTLQRNNLLRRDQIWFTEKRPDGSTDLYPLSDFHPRNDLAIDKAYLDGRFGAVPLLGEEQEDKELAGAER